MAVKTKTRPKQKPRKSTKRKPKHLPLPADPMQARVAIARDVIKRIRLEALRVRTGRYVHALNDAEFQPTLASIEQGCEVCALGACLLSFTRLYNQFPLKQVVRRLENDEQLEREDVDKRLMQVFGRMQMGLIESAFERMWDGWDPLTASDLIRQAVAFGDRHRNPSDRLLAIMQNIVDHKGEFRPDVEYVIRRG